MGADILERLELMLHARLTDEDTIIREAAAEIVRLREDNLRQANAMYADGMASELMDIAPAEAKDPAPAMPNGVEDQWKAAVLDQLAWTHMDAPQGEAPESILRRIIKWHVDVAFDTGADVEALTSRRAAENRDAAGVEYVSICGVHQVDDPNCRNCNTKIEVAPAAVPAGEAVAWLASDGEVFTDKESADRHSKVWGVNPLLTPLYTTPPAPVQAAPQEGEAAYWERWHPTHGVVSVNREPLGESIVDNRWEDRPLYRANPSACELGAVREALEAAARSLRTIAEQAGKTEGLDDMMNVRGYANSRANVAELALQHRGDSRGGEVGRG